ncbi:putative O-glycosylation ligase, exosortase A system-associated [Desulfospira joergensenii]|uniref:putative O-glycosylation ligase, exosortase A system-associated n=1 Tax=Desulfospira joergensenii TaxID=53329 RepID=UPI0003B4ACC5|nr:putative O-glycosylation ligase, exosortase A system-associated [Desulfospira joergensenii]
MRDLLVLVITGASIYLGLFRPWMGVLALALFTYLNPHRYAWGYTRSMPLYFIVFLSVILGMVLNGKDRQPFPWTRETIFFLMLLSWFTLTTHLHPDVPYAAKEQWIKVLKIYISIFPTFWMINTKEKMKWLIIVFAVSFGFVGFKGGLFAFSHGFAYKVQGPDGTFYAGNNEIGLALNMVLPLILLGASEFKSKFIKNSFYIVFFFSICSIISTWSRGALITLVTVLSAIIWSTKKKWRMLPIAVVGLMIIAVVPQEALMSFLPEEWFNRMETIQTYEQDQSAMGRIYAWKYAISRAKEHPFTGGGFETFRLHGQDVHSAYFEILGEHGYIALILWLSLLFGTMYVLGRLRSLSKYVQGFLWVRDYARAVQISLLAYAVGGAFLGVAYWDYFYHLVSLCVLMKIFLYRGIAEQRNQI